MLFSRPGDKSKASFILVDVKEDTEEFTVLGFRPHSAELLFVAAEAPGVVSDLLGTQTAVPVQHLERNI